MPMSLLLIKYFPDLGREYNRWNGQVAYSGVATGKNELGMTLLVCIVFQLWNLVEVWQDHQRSRRDLLVYAGLMLLTIHLLFLSHCATALVVSVLVLGIMVGTWWKPFQKLVGRMGVCTVAGGALVLVLNQMFQLDQMFVSFVGRDLTFTGRTEIWKGLMGANLNPLIGVGFSSFWLGSRAEELLKGYHINEAHNGYLETYLNGGIIGLLLLLLLLGSSFRRIRIGLAGGGRFQGLRLALLIGCVLYNLTEATFDRLTPLWIALLLVIIEYPGGASAQNGPETAGELNEDLAGSGTRQEAQTSLPPVEVPLVNAGANGETFPLTNGVIYAV